MKTLLCFFLLLTSLYAHEEEDLPAIPPFNITNHTIQLSSGPLSYTAITGMCPIFDEDKKKTAELFFISYTKNNEKDRPITFVFPGGPGCAATLESIISFGPRRLLTADEGRSPHPPFKLIDNPETILEYTDLVFVDPVNCGFSKAKEEADLRYFYSVEGDIQTLGEFIHTYIDISERWNSPIYLSGISYGTLRCCGLSYNLLRYGIYVKGLVLGGCAFDFSTQQSERDKTLPDCLLIPTFAATAWYHNRLWPEKTLEEVVDYARCFAYDDYAPVMLQPSRLSPVQKIAFEKTLAQLVGLPVDTIRRYNSRLNETIYTAEFFGPERKALGGLDSRYSGDIATIDPSHAHDPSYNDSISDVPAFNHYLQKELNTHFPFTPYVAFAHMIRRWDYETRDSRGEPSFLRRLREILVFNPQMKVFVGSGYYDCRTPFAATEYCFDHLDLPPTYRNNLQFEYYEAGHGYIFDHSSLKKWKQDLTKFYGH
jgi:carboxypeptidase C (cathepsin A)